MSALLDNCPLISDLEPWRNSKGYADPTAYKALRAVEISEFGHRPLTYICSPEVTLVLWTSRLGIWCLVGKGGHYG
ncbi:hypothetical protein HHJ78_10020 [Mobiluncus mulieris]|uniref:Uncharacterized protein n=2 Tax=Mobiluncus mulieris TaxID=2052 RepID=A0A7Y0U3L0_9ACTO|nr:hypothetical protein [Mobiluncus mulieris]NMW65833.1 hypothetical protein [Mobiluncus mulieris]